MANVSHYTLNGNDLHIAKPGYQIVTVGQTDGDGHNSAEYTSIQSAIDSITDASDSKQYMVQIAPGDYDENITLKSYVYLVGAGRTTTRIFPSRYLPAFIQPGRS